MFRNRIIFSLCAAVSALAFAENDGAVAEYRADEASVLVTRSSGEVFSTGAELCVFQKGVQISCGTVTQVDGQTSRLKLTNPVDTIVVGDRVAPRGSELSADIESVESRAEAVLDENGETASAQSEALVEDQGPGNVSAEETSDADTERAASSEDPEPYRNHSDAERARVEIIKYHREIIYASFSESDSDDTNATLTRATRLLLFSAGLFSFGENTGTSLSASFNVQYAINRYYAVGLWVAPQSFGIGPMRFGLTTIGGTLSYYPMDTYRGVTGTIGIGLGPASGTSAVTGNAYSGGISWNGLVTAGWRWRIGDGFSVTAQFGLQYVGVTGGTLGSSANQSTFSAIVPLGFLDVAFSFL